VNEINLIVLQFLCNFDVWMLMRGLFRFFTGLLHMGYPPANGSVYPWMEQVMASVH
jgi:hypothetical protein